MNEFDNVLGRETGLAAGEQLSSDQAATKFRGGFWAPVVLIRISHKFVNVGIEIVLTAI